MKRQPVSRAIGMRLDSLIRNGLDFDLALEVRQQKPDHMLGSYNRVPVHASDIRTRRLCALIIDEFRYTSNRNGF